MLLFELCLLLDETQISKPPEPTMHHNSIKLWILLPLRADLLVTLPNEIPCTKLCVHHSSLEIFPLEYIKSTYKDYHCTISMGFYVNMAILVSNLM